MYAMKEKATVIAHLFVCHDEVTPPRHESFIISRRFDARTFKCRILILRRREVNGRDAYHGRQRALMFCRRLFADVADMPGDRGDFTHAPSRFIATFDAAPDFDAVHAGTPASTLMPRKAATTPAACRRSVMP